MYKNRHVLQYLLINFFMDVGMNIIGPVYILFILKYIDASLLLIPNLVFHATKTLAEYPTGFLADKYGKKWSTLIGLAGMSISFAIYGFGTSLLVFIIAEFVGALALSFISGASDQWLQEKTNPETTTKVQTLSNIIGKIGSIAVVTLLGVFYIPNLAVYFFLASMFLLCAFFATFFIEKDVIQWHHKSTLLAVKSHWSEFKTNKKLLRMTIYESLRYVVEGAGIFMFWSLLFTQVKGMSIAEMFYVASLIQVGLMAGNFVAFKSGLAKKVSYTKLLGLKGVILLLMLLFPNWYAVGLFVIYEFMESVIRVKYADFINHTVKDSVNASSIRSLSFFILGLGKSFGMATMGIIASKLGVSGLWVFAAIVLILLALSRVKGLPRFTRNEKSTT